MVLMTPTKIDYAILRRLVILLGRYYQLRDDYNGIQQPVSVNNPHLFDTHPCRP